MKNRWDITVEQSNYDFNPFRETDLGKMFKTVGHINPIWKEELNYVRTEKEYDFFWPSPVSPEGDSFSYDYEELLCKDWGIPTDFVVYRQWTVNDETPILKSLAETVGLADAQINVQTQYTGMMLHLHIDSLTGLRSQRKDQASPRDDDNEWGRCFVMLEDWAPGHIIHFGNTYLSPWKAGDIIWFDWANIPHSTVNTGPWPRSIAKITGKVTDKYRKLINESN